MSLVTLTIPFQTIGFPNEALGKRRNPSLSQVHILSNFFLVQILNAIAMNMLASEKLMWKCIINTQKNDDTHPLTFENQAPKVRVA